MNTRSTNIFSDLIIYSFFVIIAIATFTTSFHGERFINLNKEINNGIAIVSLVIIIIAILWAKFKYIRLDTSIIDLLYFTWIIFVVISYSVADSYNQTKLRSYIFSFVFYLLIRVSLPNISKKRFFDKIPACLAIICSVECIIIILQYLGYLDANNSLFLVTGTFKNPAPAALLLSACLPVFVNQFFLRLNKNKISKKLSLLAIFLIVLIIPLTKNRTSWVGILVWIFYILNLKFLIFKKLRHRLGKITYCILISIIALLVIYGFYAFNTASFAGRILIWNISIREYLTDPLLGKGFGSFNAGFNKWQAEYFLNYPAVLNSSVLGSKVIELAGWVRMSYNEYLEILVECGIVGLIIFGLPIFYTLKYYWKSSDVNKMELVDPFGILIVILFSSLFSYPFYSLPTLILFNFSIAVISGYSDGRRNSFDIRSRKIISIFSLVILIISVFCLNYQINLRDAYKKYILAYDLNDQREFGQAIYYYNESSLLCYNPDYLLDYSINLLNNNKSALAIKNLQLVKNMDNDVRIYMLLGNILKKYDKIDAENNLKMGTMITPALVFPKYQLLKYYFEMGDTVKLKQIAAQILNTKEKIQNRIYDMVIDSTRCYLNKISTAK